MAEIECPRESDVLTMVRTGRWPERAPDDLRTHAAACRVCGELASVSLAIGEESAVRVLAPLPSAGVVWWRAQLRARQDAAKEVVRPITVAQAVGLATAVGLAGAVFGATADWFQHAIHLGWGSIAGAAARVPRPSLPTFPADMADMPAAFANYGTGLAVVGLGAAIAMAVMVWALREEDGES